LKIILIAAIVLAVAGGGAYYASHLKAQAVTLQAMTNMGFDTRYIPLPEAIPGQLLYSDIKLDADGLSTIYKLHTRYSPAIMLSGQLDALNMHRLSLIGELGTKLNEPDIAGWRQVYASETLPARAISIKDSRLSLMSRDFGGLNFDFDLQASAAKNNATEVIGTIETIHRDLAFSGNLNASINNQGQWQGDLKIERGKISINNILLSRVSGKISFAPPEIQTTTNKTIENTQSFTTLQIGGLRLFDTPWDNASLSIEDSPAHLKAFLEARALGGVPLELSLTYENSEEKNAFSGTLFAPDMAGLQSYFKEHPILPAEQMKQLSGMDADAENVQIGFVIKLDNPSAPQILYQINSQDEKVEMRGLFKINASEATLKKLPWRLLTN